MNSVISKVDLTAQVPVNDGLMSSLYMRKLQVVKPYIDSYEVGWCINKVLEACVEYEQKTCLSPIVACMGLASMPDSDDLQESYAKYITTQIIAKSQTEVLVVEPNLKSHKTFRLTSYQDACDRANIIVWLVSHRQFLSVEKNKHIVELDFCGINNGGYYGFPGNSLV